MHFISHFWHPPNYSDWPKGALQCLFNCLYVMLNILDVDDQIQIQCLKGGRV